MALKRTPQKKAERKAKGEAQRRGLNPRQVPPWKRQEAVNRHLAEADRDVVRERYKRALESREKEQGLSRAKQEVHSSSNGAASSAADAADAIDCRRSEKTLSLIHI